MVSNKAGGAELAMRYAGALFDLADESKSLDQTAADLVALRQMLVLSPELGRFIRNPLPTRAEQGRVMAALLTAAGVGDLVGRFVALVAANRRLFALPAMIEAFLDDLAKRRGEVGASVVSAMPLSDAQVNAVTEALKRALGSKVTVDVHVDRALLGGLLVKVGSRLIDSSVRTRLGKLAHAMKGPR